MSASLEVLATGPGNTVQDAGRHGYRDVGIPAAGAADRELMDCANALLGNPAHAAVLEIPLLGPSLRATDGPVGVAVAGPATGRIARADGSTEVLPAWRAAVLAPGDVLTIGATRGTACLALSGGIDCPEVLGSRSTYARAALGGIAGRALQTGDRLCCAALRDTARLRQATAAPVANAGPIRVIPGPQLDAFADDALPALCARTWRVGSELDRMGMRLSATDGATLRHRDPASTEIVSDGIVPGAIQVPANGRPIVLLSDCQTVGGYPKIATVISADLPRLAHFRPGDTLRFIAVPLPEALDALRERRARLQAWRATLRGLNGTDAGAGNPDAGALLAANLISGAINAMEP